MKKGQVLEGVVENMEFPNKGILMIEDRKVTVKGALLGQTIRFSVNKLRSGRAQGRLLEVLKKSEIEDSIPPCPHFGLCGGCSYQTMSYDNQLKLKEKQVKELLDSVCSDYEWEGIKGSPLEWGYRNKMEFSFGDEYKDGPLSLGMHKKNSFHDIVNITDCKIVDKDYNLILQCVQQYFQEKGNHFYKKLSHEGCLRHLVLRQSAKSKDLLINLVTSSQEAVDVEALKEHLLKLPLNGKIVGILHTINDSLADVVQSDETRVVYGEDAFYESILGLKFKISPFSFFQTNSLGAEVLYEAARGYVGETKDKVIFDLYSGTGTIAQMLAPVAKKVVGVEIVEEAVEAAKMNAGINGLTNCEFIAGDVLKVIDQIEEKPDFIVLDPPRDGIHPKALEKIIDFGVEQMVYISCKPTSLVRDLEVLQARGYQVVKGCCVDLFPETVHVEALVLFQRIKNPSNPKNSD